tara:strand:- start:2112 stop:2906 length:795 start_codon:yes stop_codon:yes gene_type:complete
MFTVTNLEQVNHSVKIGDVCGDIEPNITEDTIFYSDGEPIGFYINDIRKHSEKLASMVAVANKELRSKNVPKSIMKRSSGFLDKGKEVLQYSTIIGSIPPKPHMRRAYPTKSSVHSVNSARPFVKAMIMICRESEELLKSILPDVYERQIKIINDNVPDEWKFGRLFTSSISNYNISAPFHRDNANLKGCVNVIITKKNNAKGGNTTIPDYNATVDSCDNSMLVYPAWRNVHGVTPIITSHEGGYRNSLIFYPLKSFKMKSDNT